MATQHPAPGPHRSSADANQASVDETGKASPAEEHAGNAVGHGNSPAAWIAVGIILLGSLISCIAVVIATPWLFWAGLVGILAGVISGKVLTAMGFGEQPHS